MSDFVIDDYLNSEGEFNPEKFKQVLHYIISKTESSLNSTGTPLLSTICQVFKDRSPSVLHYRTPPILQ